MPGIGLQVLNIFSCIINPFEGQMVVFFPLSDEKCAHAKLHFIEIYAALTVSCTPQLRAARAHLAVFVTEYSFTLYSLKCHMHVSPTSAIFPFFFLLFFFKINNTSTHKHFNWYKTTLHQTFKGNINQRTKSRTQSVCCSL